MKSAAFQGTGWSFPPTFDRADYSLRMVSGADNVNQSIQQILETCHGERSALPGFGANLRRFMFQSIDQTLQNELKTTIRASLIRWEPRIDLNHIDVRLSDIRPSVVEVSVSYTIRSTNTRHNHVYPYSLTEGTNLELP